MNVLGRKNECSLVEQKERIVKRKIGRHGSPSFFLTSIIAGVSKINEHSFQEKVMHDECIEESNHSTMTSAFNHHRLAKALLNLIDGLAGAFI